MPLRHRLSTRAAEAKVKAQSALFNGGYLDLYAGTQPDSADSPIKEQKRLASLKFQDPAFKSTEGGVAVSNPLTPDDSAAATGDATWYRCYESDHKTVIEDGSVGKSGCNLNLNMTAIRQYASVSISLYTIRERLSD